MLWNSKTVEHAESSPPGQSETSMREKVDVTFSLIDVVGEVFRDDILNNVNGYVRSGDRKLLVEALKEFSEKRYGDLYTAMLEVSKHYEDGCNKYGERNWEKGIPLHCYIDSGVRHYIKWLRGDEDEPHDRAFLWNMLGALWTHGYHPEYCDLPFGKEEV